MALRDDFEDILLPSAARADTMRAWGSRYARLVLHKCADNKRRACDVLGISYHTLQAYLRYRDRPRRAADGERGAAVAALSAVFQRSDDRVVGRAAALESTVTEGREQHDAESSSAAITSGSR